MTTLSNAMEFLRKNRSFKVYLGTPFSDPDFRVRTWRYEAVTTVAGMMCREGVLVYSPITHYWPQVIHAGYPKRMLESEFWRPFNDAFLEWADGLIVLMNDGWRRSAGLSYERAEIEKSGKWTIMLDPFPWDRGKMVLI